MERKPLYDSELQVMNVLWKTGTMKATELCKALAEFWNPNTTYTVIKKCVAKGYIERRNPGFYCRPLITYEEALNIALDAIVEKYGGSKEDFKRALMQKGNRVRF